MKNLLLSVCMLVAGAAFAGNVTWTGAVNGNWSEAGNWSGATDASGLPTAADVAVFNVAEATTIQIDKAGCTCLYISINANSKALTFDGDETLTLVRSGDSITVENNNRGAYVTTFNCPVLNSNGGSSADGKDAFYPGCVYNGLVTINGGLVYFNSGSPAPSAENAKTVFRGGLVCACTRANGNYLYLNNVNNALEIDFTDPTRATSGFRSISVQGGIARIKSGILTVSSATPNTSAAASVLEVDGGTFQTGSSTLGARLVFKSGLYKIGSVNTSGAASTPNELGFTDGVLGSECETRYTLVSGSTAFKLFSPNQPSELTLDGVITATNASTQASYPRPYFCAANSPRATLKGSGTFWARGIAFDGGTSKTSPLTLDGVTLVLGDGGIDSGAQWFQALRLDGATLKGYADFAGIKSKGDHRIFLAGKTKLDTADARDPSLKRTFDLTDSTTLTVFEEDLELNVTGGGTVKLKLSSDEQKCASVSVGDGTTLSVVSDAQQLKAGSLALGDDAKLNWTISTLGALDLGGFSLTGNATLTLTIPSGTKQALIPAVIGGKLKADGLAVVLDNKSTTSYSYSICDGNLYVHTSAVTPTAGVAEWTGGGDGTSWADGENWVVAPESGANTPVYFNGFSNLNVTVDQSGLSYKQLFFRGSAASFVLTGEPLTLTSMTSGDNSAIVSHGTAPIAIANDITLSGVGTALSTDPKSCVTLSGVVTGPNGLMSLDGVFAFAGTASFKRLSFMNGHSDTKLIVANGGTVNLTGDPDLRSGTLVVMEGGTLNFTKTCTGGWDLLSALSAGAVIDGTVHVANGFGTRTATAQAISGTGRLDIGYSTIPGTVSSVCNLTGGITLNVSNAWFTTIAGKETLTAKVNLDNGILGAKGDWTYGVDPAADPVAITSTAADRALAYTGTLTVDTEDPDTAVGHTITFADPIVGGGTLVKAGAGTLVLASDENSIPSGVTLAGGALAVKSPITTGALKFAGGGVTVPKSERGSYADWTTIVTAASIEGDPVDPTGKYELRVVDGEGDTKLLQAKYNARGLLLILR